MKLPAPYVTLGPILEYHYTEAGVQFVYGVGCPENTIFWDITIALDDANVYVGFDFISSTFGELQMKRTDKCMLYIREASLEVSADEWLHLIQHLSIPVLRHYTPVRQQDPSMADIDETFPIPDF